MKSAAVLLAGLVFAGIQLAAWQELPAAAIDLRPQVAANLAATGVEHPVTAVLLNFRSYDTLLEVAVLLIAVLGILAVDLDRERLRAGPTEPMIQAPARFGISLMIPVATYLLWAGAFRPGGAFQAAAVLAAAAVLLQLTGLLAGWRRPEWRLRVGLTMGFLLFLGIAVAVQSGGRALLEYPRSHAGTLILTIELGLAVSLGLALAGLFLFVSRSDEGEV